MTLFSHGSRQTHLYKSFYPFCSEKLWVFIQRSYSFIVLYNILLELHAKYSQCRLSLGWVNFGFTCFLSILVLHAFWVYWSQYPLIGKGFGMWTVIFLASHSPNIKTMRRRKSFKIERLWLITSSFSTTPQIHNTQNMAVCVSKLPSRIVQDWAVEEISFHSSNLLHEYYEYGSVGKWKGFRETHQ